jgi:hypothetical protein
VEVATGRVEERKLLAFWYVEPKANILNLWYLL